MILFFTFTLFLQSCYACFANCDACADSNSCSTCSSGYSLSSDGSSCDSNNLSGGGIAFIVLFSVGVFICFICTIRSCCRNSPPSNNEVGVGATETNIIRDPSANNKKWQNIQSDEQFRHWQICNICLSQQLNVKTRCGHGFHLLCLQGWFRTSPTCSTCRAEINNIVLFCNVCYQRCKQLSLRDVANIHRQDTVCNICLGRFM